MRLSDLMTRPGGRRLSLPAMGQYRLRRGHAAVRGGRAARHPGRGDLADLPRHRRWLLRRLAPDRRLARPGRPLMAPLPTWPRLGAWLLPPLLAAGIVYPLGLRHGADSWRARLAEQQAAEQRRQAEQAEQAQRQLQAALRQQRRLQQLVGEQESRLLRQQQDAQQRLQAQNKGSNMSCNRMAAVTAALALTACASTGKSSAIPPPQCPQPTPYLLQIPIKPRRRCRVTGSRPPGPCRRLRRLVSAARTKADDARRAVFNRRTTTMSDFSTGPANWKPSSASKRLPAITSRANRRATATARIAATPFHPRAGQ